MNELRPCRLADIRPAHIHDIAALEQCCFPTPWSPAACGAELGVAGGGGYAAVRDNIAGIDGYIFFRVIIDEMHILKIATDPASRNRRIASALLQKAIDLAREKGLQRICLEVRASNTAAVNLYRKFNFVLSGTRSGYYDNREDALLMTKNIEEGMTTWQRQ